MSVQDPPRLVFEAQRHRLIQTTGRSRSEYVWGAVEALRAAEASFAETGVPVLVCSAPVGGLVQTLYTVGTVAARKVKRG